MMSEKVPDSTFVEAIAKLVHVKPEVVNGPHGQKLWMAGDQKELLGRPLLTPPTTIVCTTLSSVVDAIQNDLFGDGLVVHVVNERQVEIINPSVGEDRQQFEYLRAVADVPRIRFNDFIDLEQFIVHVQTNFLDTPERERLLDYVGTLTLGLTSDIEDDGATQTVTARKGVTRAEKKSFINPVQLLPYRTFSEIAQPASCFALRLKQVKRDDELLAHAALFEADGGAWRTQAIKDIGAYLREELPEGTVILA